jgi:hypothetical protein
MPTDVHRLPLAAEHGRDRESEERHHPRLGAVGGVQGDLAVHLGEGEVEHQSWMQV